MINSKQRAYLRSLANGLETIFQVGKGGVNDQLNKQIDEALEARELIKCRVLETSPVDAREAAQQIAPLVNADIVQVIGFRFVLYRHNDKLENPIVLPRK